MTTASNMADELERAEDFLNDPNKFAISRRLRDRILSALRRVEPGSDQPRPSVSEDICDAPSLRESPGKRAKPYRWDELFGILNHVGDLWTFETFRTRADAQGHIDHAQQMNPKWDLSRHRVVPVKITVSVSNRKDGSSPKTTDKGGE